MSDWLLYGYWRSSCSYRVRIALNLKGIEYQQKAVHLVADGGQQHKSEYKAVNPMAQVPSLIHDGQVIAQSMAMILYLEDTQPEPPLFPKDPLQKARTVQICEMINTGIQPIQNLSVLQSLTSRFGADQEAKVEWGRYWIERGFDALEAVVRQSAGQYCVGDQVGAADAFLIPQIYNASRFEVDMSRYPTLAAINDRCLRLDAFKKAIPEVQEDAT